MQFVFLIFKKETKKFAKSFILKPSAKVFCAKRWSSNFHSGPRCSAFKSSVESQSLRDLGNETSFTLTQQYTRNEYCNTKNNDHKTHVKDRLSMPCQLNCVETNNNRFGNMTFFWCFTAVLIVDSKMITQIWSATIVRFCWVLPKLKSIGATKPKLVLVRCRPRNT